MKKRAVLFLLCFVFLGCATANLPPVASQDFTWEEDEKRLWLRSEEEEAAINKSGLIYEDPELEAYLNEVARKLQPADILDKIPFRVKVIKNPMLNAFAFPNGAVYAHTGILAKMDNEAQLATLLAHEMTHATHRHTVEQVRNIKNMTAFLAAVQVTLGGLGGGVGDLATLLGSIGAIAAVTGYSKEKETEADMVGLGLVVKAGYDPGESPKLFLHLKEFLEKEDIEEPFFFGTHPRLQERIDNYETFIRKDGPEHRSGIKDQKRFVQKTGHLICLNACLDLKAGRFGFAEKGVNKYLGIKPDDPEAFYLLGEISRQRGEEGDIEKAKEHYHKAIAFAPGYPEPHKGLGLIHYRQGEKELSKKHFQTYLSLDPQACDALYIHEYLKHCNE